jgi:hypothetical protein
MGKERFSLFFSGQIPNTGAVANQTLSFSYNLTFDMRTLIPYTKYKDEKFIVYTHFYTSAGNNSFGGFDLFLYCPSNYNYSLVDQNNFLHLGCAYPINISGVGTNTVHVCNPNTCIPIMIEYLDTSKINFKITTKTNNSAVAGPLLFTCHLIFEVL